MGGVLYGNWLAVSIAGTGACESEATNRAMQEHDTSIKIYGNICHSNVETWIQKNTYIILDYQ